MEFHLVNSGSLWDKSLDDPYSIVGAFNTGHTSNMMHHCQQDSVETEPSWLPYLRHVSLPAAVWPYREANVAFQQVDFRGRNMDCFSVSFAL